MAVSLNLPCLLYPEMSKKLKLVMVVFDPLKMLEVLEDGHLVGQEEQEIEMKSFLVCLPILAAAAAVAVDRLSE